MTTTKTVKVSTFCDTKVDIDNVRHFIIYSPIEGDINEPWKYAIGNLPDGFKIANIKCAGDCGNVHFFEQDGLTFFYLTYYCATSHEIDFGLKQETSTKSIPTKAHPGVLNFQKSKDQTIFCTFKLESSIIESLSPDETYITKFVLPENGKIKFKISIKKISDVFFPLNIENPYDYKIDGLQFGTRFRKFRLCVPGNLNETFSLNGSLTYVRTFGFTYFEKEKEPTIIVPETTVLETLLKQHQIIQELFNVQKTAKPIDMALESANEASETLYVASTTSSSSGTPSSASSLQATETKEDEKQNVLLELQKILLKNEYTDVILKASNGIELKSYRCILAANSPTFKSIFDFNANGLLPIEIECEKFSAETILRALSFLYGKNEMLDGDELNLLEFANEYSIGALKTKCFKLLETKVSIKNVCELVKIADENNFKELKQKCVKIIAENKNDIDKKDIAKIPHSILLETFYS
uniref:BTB domain-containing protein n=1 Tax=Panagrolaimus davidi TaxID=227884 RepID=A0A914QAD7_9BILA